MCIIIWCLFNAFFIFLNSFVFLDLKKHPIAGVPKINLKMIYYRK